jgi:hypothetical protein
MDVCGSGCGLFNVLPEYYPDEIHERACEKSRDLMEFKPGLYRMLIRCFISVLFGWVTQICAYECIYLYVNIAYRPVFPLFQIFFKVLLSILVSTKLHLSIGSIGSYRQTALET